MTETQGHVTEYKATSILKITGGYLIRKNPHCGLGKIYQNCWSA